MKSRRHKVDVILNVINEFTDTPEIILKNAIDNKLTNSEVEDLGILLRKIWYDVFEG